MMTASAEYWSARSPSNPGFSRRLRSRADALRAGTLQDSRQFSRVHGFVVIEVAVNNRFRYERDRTHHQAQIEIRGERARHNDGHQKTARLMSGTRRGFTTGDIYERTSTPLIPFLHVRDHRGLRARRPASLVFQLYKDVFMAFRPNKVPPLVALAVCASTAAESASKPKRPSRLHKTPQIKVSCRRLAKDGKPILQATGMVQVLRNRNRHERRRQTTDGNTTTLTRNGAVGFLGQMRELLTRGI